jgi:metallo-beta-lactamase family protein
VKWANLRKLRMIEVARRRLKWFGAIAPSKPRVVLIHGEDGPRQALATLIRQRHGLTPSLPKQGDVIEV